MTNQKLEQLTELLEIMVKAITGKPDRVQIHTEETTNERGEETTVINIKVSSEDIPLCIGTGGSTAEAMRRIVMLAGKKIEYEKLLFVRVDAPRMPNNHFNFKD